MPVIDTPLDSHRASATASAVASALNARDLTAIERLFCADAAWQDGPRIIVGRQAILERLRTRWARALHCNLSQSLKSFDWLGMSIELEAEWQDSTKGRWYRTHTQVRIGLEPEGLISRVDTSSEDTPINASERRTRIVSPVRIEQGACT